MSDFVLAFIIGAAILTLVGLFVEGGDEDPTDHLDDEL